ncbi:MAG: DNA-directed RNA polymerase subunit beta', partial [Patescibacteria group bacterium]
FVIQKLIERGFAHHVKAAGRLIEEVTDDVWAILEEVVSDKCVLLNRAPTLHRLGIQAFFPILIEGEAIQLHPLVCPAFNADFDGDQMAVHLPLTEEAQREAREIMLSSKNLLKPATGEPIVTPSQDIILGCYYMTTVKAGEKGEGKMFYDEDEAILIYNFGEISLRAKILVKRIKNKSALSDSEKNEKGFVETSVGRIIFNQALPPDFTFVNKQVDKKTISALIGDIFREYGIERTAEILDQIKQVGFTFATKSGISWGYKDLNVPAEKTEIIKKSESEVEAVFNQYQQGLLTDDERYNRVIEIWRRAMSEISAAVPKTLDKEGSVYTIIASGARGSWSQP